VPFDLEQYLNQTMVYWAKTGTDNFGKPLFAQPVEVKCRWEDLHEQVLLLDGRTVQSNAHIMCGQRILNGSVLMLTTLVKFKQMPTYPKVPTTQQGGYEVFKSGHTPDFDGSDLLFEAWL
jgi:hypothetical protein